MCPYLLDLLIILADGLFYSLAHLRLLTPGLAPLTGALARILQASMFTLHPLLPLEQVCQLPVKVIERQCGSALKIEAAPRVE